MARRIEDYALLGNNRTAALVGLDGSIDWLCMPHFDSPACFASLLGDPSNGRWSIAPVAPPLAATRRYRPGSLVLETTFETADGTVVLTDAMHAEAGRTRIFREAACVAGRVAMRMEYVVRFDYGSIVPWVRRTEGGLLAVAGPDALLLATDVVLEAEDFTTVAAFTLAAGERARFEAIGFPSYLPQPATVFGDGTFDAIAARGGDWFARCGYDGAYREAVESSLLALKALTFEPTGGIVAAATTSLPERIGGVRNWDYRYCWLRDATFTLYALHNAGFDGDAEAWRNWLLRAVAGVPGDLQIVYGIDGRRRLTEFELPWLAGFEGSSPVRVGNGAQEQFQLDVYGEVVDLLYAAHRAGLERTPEEWSVTRAIVGAVEQRWREPDCSLWEIRGEPRHFTHSKVMAWVAFDRAAAGAREQGQDADAARWAALAADVHADVCEHAFDRARNTFTQSYGSRELDAATLLIPSVGFLPPDDPRVAGTVAAIEATLVRDGFVLRYDQRDAATDGLPPGEGAFLACSFWLVDAYAQLGRAADARALFERLLRLRNDVGLLAEEYDPVARRQLGNFPQAFSHVGLINSAFRLARADAPHANAELHGGAAPRVPGRP